MVTPPETRLVAVDGGVRIAVDQWPASRASQEADGPETGGRSDRSELPPAFLLVHGLASNSQLWWGSAARLAEVGHACASVDQRGHGRSDKPDTGYDLDTACADLLALVATLRSDVPGFQGRIIVAGQSWGANVALELGWREPEVFSGVVCVDGGTIDLQRRFPTWEDCAAALAPPRLAGTPLSDMQAYGRRAHADWPESGRQAMLANFEVRPDGTVAPWLTFERHMQLLGALWGHRPSTRYPEMKTPVLLVPADDGRSDFTADKRSAVEEAVGAIPRARAHWFSPADHDIHAQHPVALAEVLHSETTGGILA